MKNQKITRTITIADVYAVTFNTEKELVEKKHVNIPTLQKLSDKDIEEYVTTAFDHCKFLMVDTIEYRTNLYAIDLQTFVNNATIVGTGRKALKE